MRSRFCWITLLSTINKCMNWHTCLVVFLHYLISLVLCSRCSFLLDQLLSLYMVELVPWSSVDTLFMTLIIWSSASHMTNIFWPPSLFIWIYWTCSFPFCGCWGQLTVRHTVVYNQPGLVLKTDHVLASLYVPLNLKLKYEPWYWRYCTCSHVLVLVSSQTFLSVINRHIIGIFIHLMLLPSANVFFNYSWILLEMLSLDGYWNSRLIDSFRVWNGWQHVGFSLNTVNEKNWWK